MLNVCTLGKWSFPSVTGKIKPTPCSNSSLTMIDDHHAVLFGGNQPQQKKTNDVYILDLRKMVSLVAGIDVYVTGSGKTLRPVQKSIIRYEHV